MGKFNQTFRLIAGFFRPLFRAVPLMVDEIPPISLPTKTSFFAQERISGGADEQ
jgi:hypothetical protein